MVFAVAGIGPGNPECRPGGGVYQSYGYAGVGSFERNLGKHLALVVYDKGRCNVLAVGLYNVRGGHFHIHACQNLAHLVGIGVRFLAVFQRYGG